MSVLVDDDLCSMMMRSEVGHLVHVAIQRGPALRGANRL